MGSKVTQALSDGRLEETPAGSEQHPFSEARLCVVPLGCVCTAMARRFCTEVGEGAFSSLSLYVVAPNNLTLGTNRHKTLRFKLF